MPACNLIIDSCCDLPFDVVDREGIELIEFPYIAGDGEHSDDMYRSRSAHDFFDSMRNGDEPSTAQVPITVYQDVFTRAIESRRPDSVPELLKRPVRQLQHRYDHPRPARGRASRSRAVRSRHAVGIDCRRVLGL